MRIFLIAAAVLAMAGVNDAAFAQSAVEGRVDRLEREMRAVQRRVFPGGAGQYFEPQITPQVDQAVPGTPASAPLADLTQRVAALESQIATLTGQVEQSQFRLRQIEEGYAAFRSTTEARLTALEAGARGSAAAGTLSAAPATVASTGATSAPRATGTTSSANASGLSAPAAARGNDRPAAAPATAERRARVAAVERPSTGDEAEDTYVYGYRLWSANLYPEARAQLERVPTRFPNHRRASWAQNLLGRAYLDDGAPSMAAVAFYENFRSNPNGERAPDSLFFLAQALRQMNQPASEVCKVYDELLELYGDRISDQMKTQVADGRRASRCR